MEHTKICVYAIYPGQYVQYIMGRASIVLMILGK